MGELMEMIEKAQKWAMAGHDGVYRKFSDLPYIVHPEAVAQIVSEVTDDPDIIAAAWLHDIVEDTEKTLWDVAKGFNSNITQYVGEVSKISRKSDSRSVRVAIDRIHMSNASKGGKMIKLADCIHNLPTMIRDNPKFAPTYVKEKQALLEVIKDGSPLLASILYHIFEDFYENRPVNDISLRINEISLTSPSGVGNI